jgi:hypothetical protein
VREDKNGKIILAATSNVASTETVQFVGVNCGAPEWSILPRTPKARGGALDHLADERETPRSSGVAELGEPGFRDLSAVWALRTLIRVVDFGPGCETEA